MKANSLKILSLVLSILMLTGVFAGCSKNTADNKQNAAPQTEAAKSGAGSGKIANNPITLSMWVIPDAKVTMSMKSYGEIAMYKEMEKRTGITIHWIHPPAAQGNEQFNLLIASNDLPDMMNHTWPTVPGGPAKAISDGTIIKLNPLMEECAPNITKLYAEHPDWKKDAILDDGTQYMIPFIRSDLFVTLGNGLQIRQDWLDKLGLKMPATINEFHDVLAAFRDKDPNGNGKKDEVPFLAANTVSSMGGFMPAFGVMQPFYNDTAKAKYGPIEPGYKEWLKTMAAWYSEGLINKEYLTTDGTKMDQMITSNTAGSYFGMLSGSMGKYLDLMKPKDPGVKLMGVPYLKGPAGKSYSAVAPPGPQTYGATAITSKCKYPKEALKWIDYHFSPEGQMLTNFGIEGESYTMVNGKAKLTAKILKDPGGLPITNALCKYNTLPISFIALFRGDAWAQALTYPEQNETIDIWTKSYDPSLVMSKISLTADESKKVTTIINDANKYVDEISNKIIMGLEPVSKYDEIVQNLKKMNVDEAVKVYQAALDRYNARK